MNRSRPLLIAALVLSLLCAVPTISAAMEDGWYYEAVSGTANQKGKEELTHVHAWVSGPYARIEFADAPKKAMFKEGAYLITKDGGKTIYLVDPKEETYSVIDVEAMLSFATTMLANMDGVINIQFDDVQSKKLLEEDGGSVLGQDTTHHRWQSSYVLSTKVIGFKSRTEVDMLQDIWFADSFDGSSAFQVWLNPGRMRTGNEELDEMLRNEFKKLDGRFPLRNETVMTATDKKGKQSTTRTWNEVTALREEPFDMARTEIPEHYENRPMALPADMSGGANAQADGQPAEGDEEEAKGFKKAKKKFTGLFKKKKD